MAFRRGTVVTHRAIPARGEGKIVGGPKRTQTWTWWRVAFPTLGAAPHWFAEDELEARR